MECIPAGLAQINTPNGNSTTITRLANGPITLSASIPNSCFTLSKSISMGGPPININYNISPTCSGTYQTWFLSATPSTNGTNWSWSVGSVNPGSNIIVYNPTSATTQVGVSGGGSVRVNYNDLCGVAQLNGITVYSTCHAFAVIAPNPATDNVTVSTTSTSQLQSGAGKITELPWKIYQIKVLNKQVNLLKTYSYPSGVSNINIDVSGLLNGTYTLQTYDNSNWTSQQMVILR